MKLLDRRGLPWSKAMEESGNYMCITSHQGWFSGALGEHGIGNNCPISSSLVLAYRRHLGKLNEDVIVLLTVPRHCELKAFPCEARPRCTLSKGGVRGSQVVSLADHSLHVPCGWIAAERWKRWLGAAPKKVDSVLLVLL